MFVTCPPLSPGSKGYDLEQTQLLVLYQSAFKEVTSAMAGRDAGRYHNVEVAAGLRARHVQLYESALVLVALVYSTPHLLTRLLSLDVRGHSG
jgi:hypothetical protein